MKSPTLLSLFALLLCGLFNPILCQLFEPITTGSIATSQRDSRSSNFVDLNGDGYDDIFITNGPSSGQSNQLFISNGDGTFSAITSDPIVQDQSASDGASFGDMDNDGDLDAFVVTWYGERNYFYRNNGDGSFSFESSTAHTGSGTYSETCSWGDYDQDGWLDLYITNSTDFATNSASIKRNQMWHNTGTGGLERIINSAVVTDADISRSVQWIDYDLDGDPDLFVGNEENERNRLYENTGGIFGNISGPVTSGNRSSTGSSWGDIDNDGDFDLFVANFSNQNNQLYQNNGDGTFTAISGSAMPADGGCSFGSAFGDYDNDGDLDLFVANGFCGNNLQNFLYRNTGDGTFTRDNSSISNLNTQCSFGAAWGDLDNDGFLDLVVANCKGNNSQSQPPNTLLRNTGNGNNWIKFRLEGVSSNRSAIGAIVRIQAEINGQTIWQTRTISGQSGYNGQNSLTVHFGLKDATAIDSLQIIWPGGLENRLSGLSINRTHDFIEPTTNNTNGAIDAEQFLKVSPNPSRELIRLELLSALTQNDSTLRLHDTNGRLVFEQQLEPLQKILELNVGHLPQGVYMLQFSQADQQFTRPLVLH
ncbi:MAG: FG-GAP-like repeat-containing protein [Bacteroidota bacterium]